MHDIEEGVELLCLDSPPPKKRMSETEAEAARRFEWLELGADGACVAGGVYVCDDPDPTPQTLGACPPGNGSCNSSNDDDDDIVLPPTEE